MALRRHFMILRQRLVRRFALHPAVANAAIAVAAVTLSFAGLAAIVFDQAPQTSRLASYLPADPLPATASDRVTVAGRMIPTQDEWLERVKTKDFWNKVSRDSGNSSSRAREQPNRLGGVVKVFAGRPDDPAAPGRSIVLDEDGNEIPSGKRTGGSGGKSSGGDTYRTVCVRLCDGFYSPLSFSTTRDKLERDAERCEASCGGQARMFYYKNPGSEIDDMEDMDGKPYKKLPTAFRYRTAYNAQCTCRPQPWSQEAMSQHKLYALQDAASKGDKAAKQQVDENVARQKRAEAEAAAEKAAAEKAAKKAKAAEKSGSGKAADKKDKSASLVQPAAELVKRRMSIPLSKSNRQPMTEANASGVTLAPAPLSPTVLTSRAAKASPFEAERTPRTRTADANQPRL